MDGRVGNGDLQEMCFWMERFSFHPDMEVVILATLENNLSQLLMGIKCQLLRLMQDHYVVLTTELVKMSCVHLWFWFRFFLLVYSFP